MTAICPGVINSRSPGTPARAAAPTTTPCAPASGQLYERRGYGPDRVARNVLKAVARERTVAPISPEAWAAYAIKRASPRLAGFVARKLSTLSE